MNFKTLHISPPSQKDTKEAYIHLYRKYFKKLHLFSLKFLPDEGAAEDIIQNLFVSIWENKNNFDFNDFEQIEHYLFRAVRNNCITFLQRKVKKLKHNEIVMLELLSNSTDYRDHLLEKELSTKIDNYLNQLPEKSKKVFTLSRFDGLKNKQIAEKLDLTEKSIEYHITKTLKVLKEKLEEYVLTVITILLSVI